LNFFGLAEGDVFGGVGAIATGLTGGCLVPAPAARTENRQFGILNAPCAHKNAPYNPDLLWRTLRALNRPGRAQTAYLRGDVHAGEGLARRTHLGFVHIVASEREGPNNIMSLILV
jgi:hypothetical protein